MEPDSVVIHHARLGPRLAGEVFARRAAALPPALAQDLARYRRWQDRQARLWAWLLLGRALAALGQDPGRLAQLTRNPWGRPQLPGGPEFNLSHSGELVVCAVAPATTALGVDVERIRPLDLADFRSCFLPGEWRQISADPDPLARFHWLWTAKESVAKAEGLGLHLPLTDIHLHPRQAWCRGRTWHLTPLLLAPQHPGHLACDRPGLALLPRECHLAAEE